MSVPNARTGYKGVDYRALYTYALAAVKELDGALTALTARVAALESAARTT